MTKLAIAEKAPWIPSNEDLRQTKIPNAPHTEASIYLDQVAHVLTAKYDVVIAQGHSSRTIESARNRCRREWQDAVTHAALPIAMGGIGGTPDELRAARKRLDVGLGLLSFLTPEERMRAYARDDNSAK